MFLPRDILFFINLPPLCHNGSPDKAGGEIGAHPTKQGERFHKPKEKLYICTMNIRTLSIGAVMPSEILSNFEMVRVEEEPSLIRIYLIDYARPTIFASEKR